MIATKTAAAVLMLTLAFADVGAWADEGRVVEIARKSFEEGMDQYRRGDLEGARISLIQSYAAWPSVETLRNLAIAELNTDHAVEALEHFKIYAKDKNADPEFVNTKLPHFIERCEQRIGHLHVTAPPQARVIVDGRRLEDVGGTVDVSPGAHTVALTGPSGNDLRAIVVPAAQTVEVTFVASTAAASSPETGAPAIGESNRPPPRQEIVRAPATAAPEPFWTARNAWAVAVGAAAVVSAGVGLGFGLAADSQRSSINSMRAGRDSSFCTSPANASYCESLRSEVQAQQRDATVSTAAFGAAGALAAGAIVLWAVWPKASPKPAAWWLVAPLVGSRWGVTAAGRF
jgi:hypothetical protein